MKKTNSHPKKSPASKARRKSPAGPRCRAAQTSRSSQDDKRTGAARQRRPAIPLPTQLERDTLLTPLWVAESVVQEAERFLKADLPEGFAERLAARAHYLYPRHKHFRKGLNRPGNGGRETLSMFMRHWTAGWLKRARNPLHRRLPYSFGMGRPLPVE
jgi:hypothetical protein